MPSMSLYLHQVIKKNPDDSWNWESIGLGDYTIFDEKLRPGLNEKIRRHFWNREIGPETWEMFRMAMQRKMDEEMPIINLHYQANAIAVNPLLTVDMQTITDSIGSGTTNTTADSTANSDSISTSASNSTSDSDAASRAVQSETPQNLLSTQGEYATGAADSKSKTVAKAESDDTSNTEQTSNEKNIAEAESTQTGKVENSVKGFQGNAAMAVLQWRQTFVNVDMMVIEKLEDCFSQIWSTGDENLEGDNYYGGYGFGRGYGIGRGFGFWI